MGCAKRSDHILGADESRAERMQSIEHLLSLFLVDRTNSISHYSHGVITTKQTCSCTPDTMFGRHSEHDEL